MAFETQKRAGGAIPEMRTRAWLLAIEGKMRKARGTPGHPLCERSLVLMQKKLLLSLPEGVDSAAVKKGIALLNEASLGQMRKNGYECEAAHPTEMALLALSYNGRLFRIEPEYAADLINAILLHDILENDKSIEAGDISRRLGSPRAAEIVLSTTMTEPKTSQGYRAFKRRIHLYGDGEAIITRALDREQQARSLAKFNTPELLESFSQKSLIHLEEMEGAIGRNDMDEDFAVRIFSHLSSMLDDFASSLQLEKMRQKVDEIRRFVLAA